MQKAIQKAAGAPPGAVGQEAAVAGRLDAIKLAVGEGSHGGGDTGHPEE